VLLHVGIAASMRVSLLFHALMMLHLLLFLGPREDEAWRGSGGVGFAAGRGTSRSSG
jgi:hypothetical protein